MTDFNLGHVVGADGSPGAKGDKGDKGDTGATGNGIQSIALKSTSGKKKTYRITFTNGTTFDYDVYDGEDGSSSEVEIVTSWNNTLSDEKVPSEKLSKNTLDGKAPVSHASSANTYGLGSTSNYGHVKTVNGLTQSSHSDGTALSAYQGKVLKDAIDAKPSASDIPTKISDLQNDSDFIEKSNTSGLMKNDGTIDTTSYSTFSGSYNDLSNKPTIPSASSITPSADTTSGSYGSGTSYARSNHTHPKSSLYAEATHSHTKSQISDFPTIPTKTSDLQNDGDGTNVFVKNNDSRLSDARTPTAHNHDDRYYTESEMDTALSGKQATLVSGTNIKTINNNSLLGSGNITIEGGSGGGGSYINDFYGDSSTNELIIDYDTGVSQADIVISWSSTPSDSNVPSEKLVADSLSNIEDLVGDAITYINQ